MAQLAALGIPDLPAGAFQPVAGRMRLHGGKSDAPPAPDYIGQANAQAAGNLDAARAQAAANRINQVTPYGSITYTQGDGFDQARFDADTQRYKQQTDWLNNQPDGGAALRQYMAATGNTLKAPNRNDYVTNPDKWSSEIQLSDTGRQLLDADSRNRLGLAGLTDDAMARVRSALSNPFDTSGIPDQIYNVDSATGMDAWNRASDLIKRRNADSLDQQQTALDTKLANMGLTAGSEGWATQQQQFAKQRNDSDIAAELAGAQLQGQFFNQALQNAGLSNSGRAQELTARTALRNLPLQELNSLRTGSAVTNPTFSQPGQQGMTSGPDLLGATNSQYQNQLGNVNAENAQSASNTQAGVGAAASIASALIYY